MVEMGHFPAWSWDTPSQTQASMPVVVKLAMERKIALYVSASETSCACLLRKFILRSFLGHFGGLIRH